MFDKRKDPEPTVEPVRDTAPTPAPTHSALRSNEGGARSAAVIGATITIKGDITGEEKLLIEGRIEGSVKLNKNDLTIGESGNVKADVTADTVRIDGEVVGDIAGEKVIVSRSGRVNGNIVAPRVTLEDGAKFKGSIDMDPTEHAAESKPSPLRSTSRSKSKSETETTGTADADASHASG